MSGTKPFTVDSAARKRILNAEVARHASKGWSVQSVADDQAILQRKKKLGVVSNVLLSIITGGIWLIVVVVKIVNRKVQTKIITVDESGHITVR